MTSVTLDPIIQKPEVRSQNEPQSTAGFSDSPLQLTGEICPIPDMTYLVRAGTANMTLDVWRDVEQETNRGRNMNVRESDDDRTGKASSDRRGAKV